jgi:hypothetical protein
MTIPENFVCEFLAAIQRRSRDDRVLHAANGPDHAAILTREILRAVRRTLIDWVEREQTDFAGARAAIEQILRRELDGGRS